MRTINISRDEGEQLVDMLETSDAADCQCWQCILAEQIRTRFGMCSRAESLRIKKESAAQPAGESSFHDLAPITTIEGSMFRR